MTGEGIAPERAERVAKGWIAETHRAVEPRETWRRIAPRLAMFGITRIAQIGGLDRVGIPVAMAVRPLSRSVAVSLGKGASREAAAVSAAMEAIELWHAERIEGPLLRASIEELNDRPLIDPAALAGCPRDARMLWLEARGMRSGRRVLAPYALVHTDYTLPLPEGSEWFDCTSNGLASGNHPAEARIHALLEILERDAVARWQELPPADRRATRLDAGQTEDPLCMRILESCHHAGLEVAVWRLPACLELASFFCVIRDVRAPRFRPANGASCHLSARVALARALLEALQVRCTYIAGARDDLRWEEYGEPAANGAGQGSSFPFEDPPPAVTLAELPERSRESLDEDLSFLL